ncbi:hypothetical protein [Pseudoxanthomonas sp.]|uniref:hypothetical protein n=1 Tax=Pseudoxanthomonas sp. TaxID=1871049 RepID=UPI0035AD9BB8
MRLVVDANVFAAFFRVHIGAALGEVTRDPSFIMNMDAKTHQIYLDSGGVLETEWCATVDPNWCKEWMANALIEGRLAYIECGSDLALQSILKNHGFPLKGSRDVWYLRLLKALQSIEESAMVTEDLDFYQPDKKGVIKGSDRLDFIRDGGGNLKKALKKVGLTIFCVDAFYAAYLA